MKVKVNLELNLAKHVKRQKKKDSTSTSSTKWRWEIMDLCWLERPALSNSFPATRRKVKTNSPAAGEDQTREHLNKLDILMSMAAPFYCAASQPLEQAGQRGCEVSSEEHQKPDWTLSWATCSRWPYLSQEGCKRCSQEVFSNLSHSINKYLLENFMSAISTSSPKSVIAKTTTAQLF